MSLSLTGDLFTPCSSMRLTAIVAAYLGERDASRHYAASLARTARKATAYGIVYGSQLSPDNVNLFLRSIECSDTTRCNVKRELCTIWRYAAEIGAAPTGPIRVLKLRRHRRPPRAWSMAELIVLLRTAERDKTIVNLRCRNVLRCHVLPAWIRIGYDSGLRFSDIYGITGDNLREGRVTVVAQKTGKPTVRVLSDSTWQVAMQLLRFSPDKSLFSWLLTRRRAFVLWQSFLSEHGLPGTSKWLRRSAATQIERRTPGGATPFLSHSSPTLARDHYIDPVLMDMPLGPPPLPAPLSLAKTGKPR